MKLGNALTESEMKAEQAIGLVEEWQGRPLSYERINAGITNLNWRICLEDTNTFYFMKMAGSNTELFIDRALSYEASVKAAHAGFAPQVLHYFQHEDVEIHEFLDGYRSCNAGDLLVPDTREKIARAYQGIHQHTLSKSMTGFDQLKQRLAMARDAGALFPPDIEQLLSICQSAESGIAASGMDLKNCFNDAYVSNFMISNDADIKMIDWEYASNNDPYWDLALFSAEAFYGDSEIKEMIEIHDGRYTEAAAARIYLYSGVAWLTWSLWAAAQAKISSINFDFNKYSQIMCLKARQKFGSPHWAQSLTLI